MSDNLISKILKGIGIGTIVVGVLASLIAVNSADSMVLIFIGIIGSVISGMIYIGFSEIISLLQQSVDNQSTIIKALKEKQSTSKVNAFNSIRHQPQDVAPKFTNSASEHLFRCANCGRMIEKYPCYECGYKFN